MKVIIQNLTKSFKSIRGTLFALNDITIHIADGEFFVLLGPSGSGKSTLLNLISGLERPTDGEIWFDKILVASPLKGIFLSPKDRNVAFVFQSYALYPHMTVFGNIAFPLKISGIRKEQIKSSVEKAAFSLEISDLLYTKPGELSGGQRQRVAIARAIVRHPNIFLLDEPLSNLDPQLRLSMRSELKNLQRRLGITTIYVTHDQTEAMSLGDQIAVLKGGQIEQIGTPEELYERPKNPFVAAFIGSPSMNLIKARWVEEKGAFFVRIEDKRFWIPDSKIGAVKRLKTKACILGIRPEHIYIAQTGSTQSLNGKIISVESLGRDKVIIVLVNDQRFSILSSKKGFREGDIVAIGFDMKKAHIFES